MKKVKHRQNRVSNNIRSRSNPQKKSPHKIADNEFNVSKVFQMINIILKQSALIIGILWIASGISKLFLLNKYNISFNFFSIDLIDDFPKYTLLVLVYLLFTIPYFTLKNKSIGPIISKLYLFVFGISASFAIFLFNMASIYSILKEHFNIYLYSSNFLLIVVFVFTLLAFFSYISLLNLNFVTGKSNVKSNILNKRILYWLKVILSVFLIILIIYSSIFYLISYKIPFVNSYDIVEIDSIEYVVLLNYRGNLIVSEFTIDEEIINIHNSKYYIVSPIGVKFSERFFLDTKLDE